MLHLCDTWLLLSTITFGMNFHIMMIFFSLKSLSLDHILLKAVMQNWCANVEILDTGVWLKKATLNFNKGSSPDLEEKEWNVDCNRSSLKVKVFDF